MAKVLISFIGTGPLVNKGALGEEKSAREYRRASYHLGEENLGEYSFMAAALYETQNIDRVILIGTAHCMWEEVYRYFQEKNGGVIDEDVYCEIPARVICIFRMSRRLRQLLGRMRIWH